MNTQNTNNTTSRFLSLVITMIFVGIVTTATFAQQRAVRYDFSGTGSSDFLLIAALAKNEQFSEALKYADESSKIALSRKEGQENNSVIADIYLTRADIKKDMENCSEAIEDYDKSLQFYQKISQIKFNLFKLHKGKLLCFQKLGQQENFQKELETVLKISEEYRQNIREDQTRQAFFDNEQIVFDAAISNALRNNESRKAFDFAEASKSRLLLDFVKSEKSIAELEREFSTVAKPLSIEEIQSRMPYKMQVVQYALLEDKLAIWVITKDRFEFIEKQISTSEIEKKYLNIENPFFQNQKLKI